MSYLLECKKISKYYDSNHYILKDFDFALKNSESIAIMGSSGVGKTTLLNIIGLLDRPNEGIYTIEGQWTGDLNVKQQAILRNKNFGFIFQQDRLIAHYDVKDNVRLPLMYRGISRYDSEEIVNDCLDYFDLSPFSKRYPRELSGGQRQRVALARALVHQPKVLLADEPTASLDHDTKHRMLERLFALKSRDKFSVILITHDAEVAKYCEQILTLDKVI